MSGMGRGEEGRGGEAEKVVVMEVNGGEEEEEAVVRWEKLLPRMPVRVLLVEGDDSTRQIIAALLRKCGYRVVTASDGLKAWESMKEKSHIIDLVLTEVDLPSVSGFNLLTMIMDHEACKNIPVIMMSSHDSISVVFKCMLRGAVDFLVKPIRKNELSNLWQHVWRKQLASAGHGPIHSHEDEHRVNKRIKARSGKGILQSEHEPLPQDNKECSEQGSDAQSSCTRSDMEAESKDKKIPELKLPNVSNTTLKDHKVVQNGAGHYWLESAAVIPNIETKLARTTDAAMTSVQCLDDTKNTIENYSNRDNHDKSSKKVVDLLETGNQTQSTHLHTDNNMVQNGLANTEGLILNEVKNNSSCMPYLELSLRRYEENCNKQQNDECIALNHSNSSAFSLYSSRIVLPTSSKPINNLANQSKECNHTFNEPLQDRESSAQKCNGLAPAINLEDTKTVGGEAAVQDGSAVQCTPFRVIPFPVPAGGMPFDGLCSGYGPVVQPLFYQQPAHTLWNSVPFMWQDAASHANSLQHLDTDNLKFVQSDHSARSSSYHSAEKQENTMQLLDEKRHASTGAAESQSSSIHNGGRICNATTVNSSTSKIFKASKENGHVDALLPHQGTKPTEFRCLSQREAALNKFRLKRKERCFEKKVHYQSRKILAEQRPRVKGQFVRKEQLHSQSVPASYSPSDPATG